MLRAAGPDPGTAGLHPRPHRLRARATRCYQRLEKLLEGALIKLSSVASKLTTESAKDMVRALIGGGRDPHVLAGLARTRMKAKHDALVEALTGMFDAHHGELAQLELDQVKFLDQNITQLEAPSATPWPRSPKRRAWTPTAPPAPPPAPARTPPCCPPPPAGRDPRHQPGPRPHDHRRDRPEHHPVPPPPRTWSPGPGYARPRTSPAPAPAPQKHGNAYLRGALGQAALGAARTGTSSANGTAASPAAAARPRPRSLSPVHPDHHLAPARRPCRALHRPRPGLCRLPGPTGTRRSATTSASSRPWDCR